MKYIIILISILIFTGCVPKQPQLTRQQWINITSHTYTGITKEQAINAAEKVLRLADGDDFLIVHNESGFHASRNWVVYIVIGAAMGTDYWKIVVTEKREESINVEVQISTQMNTIASAMEGRPVNGTAIYDLFWSRFEYLIKKNNNWLTCKKADEKLDKKITWGLTEQLCNSFNVDDNVPEGVFVPIIPKTEEELNLEKLGF